MPLFSKFCLSTLILVLKNFLFLLLGSLRVLPKIFLAIFIRSIFLKSRSGRISLVPFLSVIISCMDESPSTPLPLDNRIKKVSI